VGVLFVIAVALVGGLASAALRQPPALAHAADLLLGPKRVDDRVHEQTTRTTRTR
jgi:hypothetical protein